MTRQIYSIMLLFFALVSNAQNYIDLRTGFSWLHADAWNNTIQTYNETRFWQESQLTELKQGSSFGLAFSGVLGKGFFLSPSINYKKFSAKSNLEKIDLQWLDLGLACDIYPLEFRMDSVSFRLRPFVRIGFAGSMLLARIALANGPATIDAETYAPYNWPYLLHTGIGLRYQPRNVLGFFILIDASNSPNASITDFRKALLGSLYANSKDKNKTLQLGLHAGLTFRLKN
jgi:hypothetical protein